MMFVHSPLSNKKTSPNVRKSRSRKAASANRENINQGPNQIFSPTNGTTKTYAVKKKPADAKSKWPKVKPWKVIVGSIVIGMAGITLPEPCFSNTEAFTTGQPAGKPIQ